MKIVLIHDQILIRKGLASLISLGGTLEVYGEAGNKEEALELIKKEKPDLAVIDTYLGGSLD